jgi:ABC-type multidrug transport system permease subunit
LIWPLETLHPAFRYLAQFFPITHAVAALREIMLGGAGFVDIQGRFYALLAFAVLMILFGAGTLRKQQG